MPQLRCSLDPETVSMPRHGFGGLHSYVQRRKKFIGGGFVLLSFYIRTLLTKIGILSPRTMNCVPLSSMGRLSVSCAHWDTKTPILWVMQKHFQTVYVIMCWITVASTTTIGRLLRLFGIRVVSVPFFPTMGLMVCIVDDTNKTLYTPSGSLSKIAYIPRQTGFPR
jgi:hypothetical protein